jgi:putative NADH-flavin reductase
VKLLTLGATGGLGRQLVSQALDAGHDVTAYARTPSKIAARPRLTVISGDLQNTGALAAAMRGHDAVISAIGRGQSFSSQGLIKKSVPPMLAAMNSAGVRRLLFVSALGVGDSFQDSPIVPRIFFRTLLRDIYADKLAGDRLIRNSDLEWTIVQPAQLNDGPLTRNYQHGERLALRGMPQISRADTAHFLLDRLSDPDTIGKTLIVSN